MFVELTSEGSKTSINVDNILYIRSIRTHHLGTKIVFVDGSSIEIAETYEVVRTALEYTIGWIAAKDSSFESKRK